VKSEIYEIPYRAELCYLKNKGVILPEDVPYIGMGASNVATEVFRYLGINIFPEKAAEYYNYLIKYKNPENGVLISQSGHSSETLWCADYVNSFVAIVNDEKSPLAQHKNCNSKIFLHSGDEQEIAAKTYLNTLLVLYLGFGFDPAKAIYVLKDKLSHFEQLGEEIGELIKSRFRWRRKGVVYVLGNGPNVSTAKVSALALSRVIKVPVLSMSVSQYEHGFIETANSSLVIAINHEGPEKLRTSKLLKRIENAGAKVFEVNNTFVSSIFSPLTLPMSFYFAAEYLAQKMNIKAVNVVGNKVTRHDSTK
jgi:glucosamine--fructose-6-phosphate aminotransferase (isomerizing)